MNQLLPDDFTRLKEIDNNSDWAAIEWVPKGWSEDKKYRIIDKNGRQFLLRVSDINEYDRKKREFEYMTRISRLEIKMSLPIRFGLFAERTKVYSLLSWVDGKDAETELLKFSEIRQYELGLEAGLILKKIHSVDVSAEQPVWEEVYKRKITRLIEKYRNCPIIVPDEQNILRFIQSNLGCLEGRPNTFQHGDYHMGNLIITTDGHLGVIDFNRCGFGDPWEEYDRYIFTWRVSIPFAIGQIHAYFDNKVPDQFFRLMALYSAVNIISSIPWSIRFGGSEINTMLTNAAKIIGCYNGFRTYIPDWYEKSLK